MRLKPIDGLLFLMLLSQFLVSGGLLVETGYAVHHKPMIVFASARDGNAEIYVMDADGKNQRRLTNHPLTDSQPSWSPDGKKIAFMSNRNGGNLQIFVMDSDGQNPVRLTDDVWDQNPSWSPDGRKIAFTGFRDAGLGDGTWDIDIYVMDPDGKNRRRLTRVPGSNSNPSWSPDGKRIAFANTKPGASEIYVMNADGTRQKSLTQDDKRGNKREPSWSPDGQSIAFVLNNLRSIQIYVMDSDGENLRKLTDGKHNWSPAWSPDSEIIAYESWRGNDHISEIHLMTADGTYLKQLSGLHERGDWDPDWLNPTALAVSPTGNKITIWGRLKKLAPNLR